jgi:HAD superfamily hydrolase (TIGR01509 family)
MTADDRASVASVASAAAPRAEQAGLVIFDLDGTLVDSEPNYLAAEQRLLAEVGVLGFDERAKRPYVGMSTTEMLMDLIARHGITEPLEHLVARKDEHYIGIARERTTVFEPMRRFAEALAARNMPLALASGSTPNAIEAVLDTTGLRSLFSAVVSSDLVDRGKPEPDLFLETAARVGVLPDRCVVVEDSHYGREAARRAGMRCVFVPGGPDQLRSPADTEDETDTDRELVFPEGMPGFVPETALKWVLSPLRPGG